ncbi:MAG: hypothetical protein OXF04_06580 [bacterium]|nr:hypothetical protein [bacterium]MCY4273674.1 hypothetical protein [bacterium]
MRLSLSHKMRKLAIKMRKLAKTMRKLAIKMRKLAKTVGRIIRAHHLDSATRSRK